MKSLYNKFFDCLKYSISKDETRPFLNGVIHYEPLQALVSCDGYRATVLKRFYDARLKGLILTKEYGVCDREYPRIENILPDISKPDISKLESGSYVIEKRHFIKDKKPVKIFFCKEGKICMDEPDEFLFCLDSKHLKPLADGSNCGVKFKDNLSPVIFALGDDFDNFYLVMPLKI